VVRGDRNPGPARHRAGAAILAAFNPLHALAFVVQAPSLIVFAVLGAIFLAVTGGEAMYADLGHFGRAPIRLAWFGTVLPESSSTTSVKAPC
jgi:KUP system potassium uptake protein